MITPAKTFEAQAKENGWRWLDTVDSTMFHAAVTATLAEMNLQFGTSASLGLESAAYTAWRMEGAKDFLRILMKLTDTKSETVRKPTGNLEHKI